MLSATVARPYARAVFELAQAASDPSPWQHALQQWATLCQDPLARQRLSNPLIHPQAQHRWLVQLSQPWLFAQAERLLQCLSAKRRWLILPDIHRHVQGLWADHQALQRVICRSFMPLDLDSQAALKTALERRFGGQVQLDAVIQDASLLGGVVLQMGDRVIDGSLRGRLDRLRQQIMNQGT